MGAIETVQSLMRAGVEFAVEGDRILWRNSGGRVTPEVVESIRAEKPRVRDFLARGQTVPAPGPAAPQAAKVVPLPVSHKVVPDPAPLPDLTGAGRVRTWTGRVVSLDTWRKLNTWDRHGPNGRQWDGRTASWEWPEGGGTA